MNNKINLLKKLKDSNAPVIIWGVGYVGLRILEICQEENIQVKAFCDRNMQKIGKKIAEFEVLSVEKVLQNYPDAEVVFAMNRLEEANDELLTLGHTTGHAGALLFDVDEVLRNPKDEYALSNDIYDLQLCTVVHNIFEEKKLSLLGSLDCVITEKCTLKCRNCSNLMQYYSNPINYDVEQVMSELETLLQFVDHLFELRLIGGDVFVNKNWDVLLKFALGHPKIDRITFYTNGTIIPQKEKLSLLSNEKVLLQISDYGKLSRNLERLIKVCNENHIWYRAIVIGSWNDCSAIKQHKRTTKENDELFRHCCTSNVTTLQSGRIFRCPFVSNAFQLEAIPDSPRDYVNIMNHELLKDIEGSKTTISNYLSSRKAIPACDYCDGRVPGVNEIPVAEQSKDVLNYKRVKK